MTVKDNSGTEITNISTLNHVIVTGAKGVQVSGYDITNTSGLITLFNNREITTTSSKEEKWNITITFVNYDASQNANAGKSMSAKVMIQKNQLLAGYIISQFTGTQGDNGIYYHNSSLANGAGDNSYRYAGASENVNNFVCFGSNESPCPTVNLYRIIGVFGDQVKLIKYDYATSALLGTDGDYYGSSTPNSSYYKGSLTKISVYYWNKSTKTNTWSESNLNKVNLNTNYLNNIGTTWSNLIEDTTWKVSGHTTVEVTPKAMYTAEITNATKTYGPENGTSKIGLMYVSDYGFAAAPSAWTRKFSYDSGNGYGNAAVTSVNWMYMGLNEWTISRSADYSDFAFRVAYGGSVDSSYVNCNYAVRPSFYLLSSVIYAGGTGTTLDPIRIK